ncbi:2-phospho-L-lactate guanylyltransferase [Aquipuribacter hungaricus]|uniref:2-phospho-L-lactate guanylyltransferase n=1 Tax=Aquipuribacter hungaricus TaxID=545624 RepID=A0ABV7WEP6_9MICO
MRSADPQDRPGRWTVVLPVKGGTMAKSRLRHPARAGLAAAVALDTTAAVAACPRVRRVLVVTGDAATAAAHVALGAEVVADPGGGLAAALAAGALAAGTSAGAAAAGQSPTDPGPCALLLADLPALRPDDLAQALQACEDALAAGADQVTVPDADGTGTVLLAAASPRDLRPRFGPGSAAAHAATSVVLVAAPARLRRDVDTAEHLAEAEVLGVGPRTAAVLAAVQGSA